MASALSKQTLLFVILFYLSTTSPTPPLLALINCTTPTQAPLPTTEIGKHIKILLVNPTANGTQTLFATSSFSLEPHRIIGLIQCPLHLSLSKCTICIQTDLQTISKKSLNSKAVTVWLGGCYVQYCNSHNYSCALNATKMWMSPSNRSSSMDGVQFGIALKNWLSMYKVAVVLLNQSSHYIEFSQGEVIHEKSNDDTVHGVAECIQAGSTVDCEVCLKVGTEKLENGVVSDSRNGGPDVFVFDEHDRSSVSTLGFKEKVACAWSVGVVCLVGVIVGAWCLRRKVVNNAKVGIIYAGTTAHEVESIK